MASYDVANYEVQLTDGTTVVYEASCRDEAACMAERDGFDPAPSCEDCDAAPGDSDTPAVPECPTCGTNDSVQADADGFYCTGCGTEWFGDDEPDLPADPYDPRNDV